MPTTCVAYEVDVPESHQVRCGRFLSTSTFYGTGDASLKFTVSRRELSSQADASSTKDDDGMESGLSELDTDGDDNEYEKDLVDGDEDGGKPHDELELSDTEIDQTEKKSERRKARSELFFAILKAPGLSVHSALDEWVEKGKELSGKEISLAVVNLRRRKMYGKVLQVNEANFLGIHW